MRGISSQTSNIWGLTGFLLGLWMLLSIASYVLLAIPREQRFDFYPRWVGARAMLRGENSYSDQVTSQIQEGMFGRQLGPEEDQQRFAYSALITWLLLPFWLLPFPIAISLWCGLQLLLLLLIPLLMALLLNWRISPASLIIILVFSIFVYRYPINAYLLGQFIPFCMASLVAAWYCLVHDRPFLASIALIMAMVRPEIIVFPLVALLIIAWEMGYRRVVAIWIAGIGSLWLLTHLWVGPWEWDFIKGLGAYQVYSAPIWPPSLFGNNLLALLFVIAILVWGIWLWKEVKPLGDSERIGWVLSFTALIGLVLFPQTGNYTLILGLITVWVILWVFKGHYLYWILVFSVLCSPWIFMIIDNRWLSWEHLIIPVCLILLLTFSWWRMHTEGW